MYLICIGISKVTYLTAVSTEGELDFVCLHCVAEATKVSEDVSTVMIDDTAETSTANLSS